MAIKATIGAYPFHIFEWPGNTPQYGNDIQVIQQMGVDNADFRLLGKHSEEFQVLTEVNVENEDSAWNTLRGYVALVGAGLQRLVIDPGMPALIEQDFDLILLRLKVLRVTGGGGGFQPVRRVGGITGGVNANGWNTLLAATWTVKWVPYPAPP